MSSTIARFSPVLRDVAILNGFATQLEAKIGEALAEQGGSIRNGQISSIAAEMFPDLTWDEAVYVVDRAKYPEAMMTRADVAADYGWTPACSFPGKWTRLDDPNSPLLDLEQVIERIVGEA